MQILNHQLIANDYLFRYSCYEYFPLVIIYYIIHGFEYVIHFDCSLINLSITYFIALFPFQYITGWHT